MFTDLSPSRDLSFLANNPAAENARSASSDVGGMLDYALISCSNLLGRVGPWPLPGFLHTLS